jgi:hypothetical protein
MEAPVMKRIGMKRIGMISAAAFFLLLGNTARTYAQQEQQEPNKPAEKPQENKPVDKPQETKPAEKPQETKPMEKPQDTKPAEKPQEQPKTEKQQEPAKTTKQEEPSKAAQHQPVQRTAAAQKQQNAHPALKLSARGTGRIPDDRFRASFGQEHVFVINDPVIVGGFSRFQYSGFWFGFVDPWPVGWYYTDNVYVDYIDGGYFLCNPEFPGANVSISVVI